MSTGVSDTAILFDAGNTRLKWAVKDQGALRDHGALVYASESIAAALDAAFVDVPPHAVIGSVAEACVFEELSDWLTARGVSVTRAEVSSNDPLHVAYDDPSRLGVDRWLAMLGARTLSPGHWVVADCGTALTLDAIDAQGTHLGGLIAPGHELMQRALLTQTARIDAADQPLPDTVFGDSTGSAVNAGATFAMAALLDRFVADTHQRLEEAPLVVATGGGRERLLRYAHCDVIEVPDLVLLGLATLAGD